MRTEYEMLMMSEKINRGEIVINLEDDIKDNNDY